MSVSLEYCVFLRRDLRDGTINGEDECVCVRLCVFVCSLSSTRKDYSEMYPTL